MQMQMHTILGNRHLDWIYLRMVGGTTRAKRIQKKRNKHSCVHDFKSEHLYQNLTTSAFCKGNWGKMISQWVTFFVTAVARNLLLNIYVCIYFPNFDIPTENNSLEISWPFKHGLILDICVEFQGGIFLGPSIFFSLELGSAKIAIQENRSLPTIVAGQIPGRCHLAKITPAAFFLTKCGTPQKYTPTSIKNYWIEPYWTHNWNISISKIFMWNLQLLRIYQHTYIVGGKKPNWKKKILGKLDHFPKVLWNHHPVPGGCTTRALPVPGYSARSAPKVLAAMAIAASATGPSASLGCCTGESLLSWVS